MQESPRSPKITRKSGAFHRFVKPRLTKKETGFRLSLMVREGGVEPPRPE